MESMNMEPLSRAPLIARCLAVAALVGASVPIIYFVTIVGYFFLVCAALVLGWATAVAIVAGLICLAMKDTTVLLECIKLSRTVWINSLQYMREKKLDTTALSRFIRRFVPKKQACQEPAAEVPAPSAATTPAQPAEAHPQTAVTAASSVASSPASQVSSKKAKKSSASKVAKKAKSATPAAKRPLTAEARMVLRKAMARAKTACSHLALSHAAMPHGKASKANYNRQAVPRTQMHQKPRNGYLMQPQIHH